MNSSILGEGSEKDPQGVEGPPEKDPQVVEGPPERPSCFIQCWFVFTLKTIPFLLAHTLFIWFYKYEFCFFFFMKDNRCPCENTKEKLYPAMILFSVGWFHCYQIFIQYL